MGYMLIYLGRGLNKYNQSTRYMSEEAGGTKKSSSKDESRDEIIRKRSFSRARGIDISSFMVDDGSKEESVEVIDEIEVEQDIAMGEIAEIFSKGGEDFARPGAIQKDGTVKTAPENDSVTDLAEFLGAL